MKFRRHEHLFLPDGGDACILRDSIEYDLPISPLSEVAAWLVIRKLQQMFDYRHQVTRLSTE